MKRWLSRPGIMAGVVVVFVVAALVWAGTSHMDALVTNKTLEVGTTLTVGSAPITVANASAMKTMVFNIDSLGFDDTIAVFTLERGITVMRADIFCQDTCSVDTCYAIFTSGASLVAVYCTTGVGSDQGSWTTDVSFAAASVCTLITYDGSGGGTGGIDAKLILQYTDY